MKINSLELLPILKRTSQNNDAWDAYQALYACETQLHAMIMKYDKYEPTIIENKEIEEEIEDKPVIKEVKKGQTMLNFAK